VQHRRVEFFATERAAPSESRENSLRSAGWCVVIVETGTFVAASDVAEPLADFIIGAILNRSQSGRFFLQVHRSMASTIGPSISVPPSPRQMAYELSARWSRRRL
jgi:hypothetical protein